MLWKRRLHSSSRIKYALTSKYFWNGSLPFFNSGYFNVLRLIILYIVLFRLLLFCLAYTINFMRQSLWIKKLMNRSTFGLFMVILTLHWIFACVRFVCVCSSVTLRNDNDNEKPTFVKKNSYFYKCYKKCIRHSLQW